jgi:type II secretory pathway component PulF
LFRAAHNAEYLETLALLYGGGVPIGESHALAAAAVARAPVRRALERAAAGLRGGLGLAPSLAATGVMDPMVLGMIANGEATGGLEEALVQAAALLREAELRDLRRAATLAGGILYAIAVVVVIVVVFRFYSTLLGRLR